MNRRDTVLALVALGAASGPVASLAQQQGKVRRIGYLSVVPRSSSSNVKGMDNAFLQGMRELGYVEGKDFVIEWRFADGRPELLPGLAAELVRLKVDVIVTGSTVPTQAAKQATSSIPIVFPAAADPIGSGFVASLTRPGGNITGQSLSISDVSPKHVELLRTTVPTLSRLAVVTNPQTSSHPAILKSIRAAADKAGVNVLPVSAGTPEEIERGFLMMTQEHAEAVIFAVDAVLRVHARQIAQLVAQHRIPSMFGDSWYVEVGGLMSYGQDLAGFYRRAATYVDKILKGAKPGDLPIEQPTIFELVVNRKTAKALGLTIPPEILLRADRVIE